MKEASDFDKTVSSLRPVRKPLCPPASDQTDPQAILHDREQVKKGVIFATQAQ
jgi:hypothetical protein